MVIDTAAGSKSLKSEGVGKMQLITPNGDPVSGFDLVIFFKSVAEKLANVGELCDSGYVFVFDDKKLTTYSKEDFSVQGKALTMDERDLKSKLYPLTLYRKSSGFMPVANVSQVCPAPADVQSLPPSISQSLFPPPGGKPAPAITQSLSPVGREHAPSTQSPSPLRGGRVCPQSTSKPFPVELRRFA